MSPETRSAIIDSMAREAWEAERAECGALSAWDKTTVMTRIAMREMAGRHLDRILQIEEERWRTAFVRAECRGARRCIVATALAFGVSVEDILSRRRTKQLSIARQAAMWLSRRATGKSYPALGELFQRDHTTIMHGEKETQWRMANNIEFDARMNALLTDFVGRVAA